MKVFVLEDDPLRVLWFRERFIEHEVTLISSCTQIDQFKPPYSLILLDHDLGGRQMEEHEDCGLEFIRLIRGRIGEAQVGVHSYNHEGAMRMIMEHPAAHYVPFRGSLFNRLIDLVEKEQAPI